MIFIIRLEAEKGIYYAYIIQRVKCPEKVDSTSQVRNKLET